MIVEYAGDLLANEPSPARRGDRLALAAAHLGLTHAAPAYDTTAPLHPKWAHTAGPLHRTLNGHDGDVYAVAVGRLGDRDVIVSGGVDGTVRIWDEDGNSLGRPLTGHDGDVNAVAVGRLGDRDVIVSGGDDSGGGTVRIWDQDGQPVDRPLTGHDGDVYAVAVGRLGDRDV
jgi:WD40 repeat protein